MSRRLMVHELDSVGTSIFSGVGGQVDFERGAAVSRGGIPIICLPSTTKHGESRIVSMLKPGAGVITSRNRKFLQDSYR
jgi:4-hydroxybutyrate CoA-transferase